jgi:hypothetical protein
VNAALGPRLGADVREAGQSASVSGMLARARSASLCRLIQLMFSGLERRYSLVGAGAPWRGGGGFLLLMMGARRVAQIRVGSSD